VDDDAASLAGEAEAAIRRPGAVAPRSAAAARVAAARARFLPYLSFGGASFASVVGAIAAMGPDQDGTAVEIAAGTSLGLVVGIAIGWVSLQALEWLLRHRSPRRALVDAAIIVSTVPAYVVGGWTAALVIFFASTMGDPTPPPAPDAWGLLAYGAVIVYPLSYYFARRDPERPTNLVGAVSAAVEESDSTPKGSWLAVGIVVGTTWTIVSLIGLLAALAAFISLVPDQYVTARERFDGLFTVATLLAWIGLAIGLTGLTMRLLRHVFRGQPQPR
jgi:hypothetical protein